MGIDFIQLVIVVLVLGLILLAASAFMSKPGQVGDYKQADIMTANELEFFDRLVQALPGHYVFPQISMGALLRPAISRKSPDWMKQYNRISSQRVDFAIYSPQMKLLTLIELDDKTHNTKKDRERDRRTQSAGIKTLRYESKAKPPITKIRDDVTSLAR